MNCKIFLRKVLFPLIGLWVLGSVMNSAVLAAECALEDKTSWEKCKGKPVKVSGPRLVMDDVPTYYMLADPAMSGGEGFQDYIEVAETQVILHTKDEVECPDKMEVEGTVKQLDLEGEKAWAIDVTQLTCQ